MATEEVKSEAKTPEAPAILPAELKAKWRSVYAEEFKAAQADHPEDVPAQRQQALREANRLLRVPEIQSAADADRLPKWQVLADTTAQGVRKLVTIDGRKYKFPAGRETPAGKDGKGPGEKPAA